MDIMDANDPQAWPDKIVGKSFKYGDFTGWWYEDHRLEVHHKGEYYEIVFSIAEDLANSEFLYMAGAPFDQIHDGSINAEITESGA